MDDSQAFSAEETVAALSRGGIPPGAAARLKDNAARRESGQALFTSNLSVNEFLLTRDVGYEPLGQVMGTTVYQVGWQYTPGQSWGSYNPVTGLPYSQELAVLTQANYEARSLAFSRLAEEATCLRADGVVGVRLERLAGTLEAGFIEFKAIGTAVREINRTKPPTPKPFISNLSGQDHWALRKAGMIPIGFVFGNCSWYQVSGWANQTRDNSGWFAWNNSELPDFTQGVYQARELAMTRLFTEAASLQADGVIGVVIQPHLEFKDIENNNTHRRDLLAQFTVLGTAVKYESSAERPSVVLTLPLTD